MGTTDDDPSVFSRETLFVCLVAFLFGNGVTLLVGGWRWELVFVMIAAFLLLETCRRHLSGLRSAR